MTKKPEKQWYVMWPDTCWQWLIRVSCTGGIKDGGISTFIHDMSTQEMIIDTEWHLARPEFATFLKEIVYHIIYFY